jgi:hypothetical protein
VEQHNEETNDVFYSPVIVGVIKSRRMRWVAHMVRMWDRRGLHKVLVGKPAGNRQLGEPSCRWEDNIKMELQEVGCAGMD